MLPAIFVLATAHKTAEAIYVVYLYCFGSGALFAAISGGLIYFFSSGCQPETHSLNEDLPLENLNDHVHELPNTILQNIVTHTDVISTQNNMNQQGLSSAILELDLTISRSEAATNQFNNLTQPLQSFANDAEIVVRNLQNEIQILQDKLTTTTNILQQTQIKLSEKENILSETMDNLTTTQQKLAITSINVRQQLKQLAAQQQMTQQYISQENMVDFKRQIVQLSQTNVSLTKMLDEMSTKLINTMKENQNLQTENTRLKESTIKNKKNTYSLFYNLC